MLWSCINLPSICVIARVKPTDVTTRLRLLIFMLCALSAVLHHPLLSRDSHPNPVRCWEWLRVKQKGGAATPMRPLLHDYGRRSFKALLQHQHTRGSPRNVPKVCRDFGSGPDQKPARWIRFPHQRVGISRLPLRQRSLNRLLDQNRFYHHWLPH